MAGDESSLDRLIKAFEGRLRAYFRARFDLPEDAVQETILRVIMTLRRRRAPVATFENWLFGVARNVYVDLVRRRVRDRRALDLPPPPRPPDPHDEYDLREQVWTAVERLPPHHRRAVRLRYIKGLSYRTIAHRLSISESAVAMRLSRAKRRLEKLLRDDTAPARAYPLDRPCDARPGLGFAQARPFTFRQKTATGRSPHPNGQAHAPSSPALSQEKQARA